MLNTAEDDLVQRQSPFFLDSSTAKRGVRRDKAISDWVGVELPPLGVGNLNSQPASAASPPSPQPRTSSPSTDWTGVDLPPLTGYGPMPKPVAPAPSAAPEEQGFFAGTANALMSGAGSTVRGIRAGLNTISGDNNQVAVIAKDQALASKNDPLAQKAFQEDFTARKKIADDGIYDAVKNLSGAIYDNPEGAFQTVVSQVPNSAVALGLGYAGAATGAAIGSALLPGAGTLAGGAVGGFVGLVAGLFGANTILETGGKAIERGMDGQFTDEERKQTLKEGVVKGAVITTVDTLTLGGSRWILNTANRAVETATARALGTAGIDATALGKSITTAQRAAFEATASQGREASQAAMTRATAEVLERAGANSPGVVASVRQAQSAAFESVNTFAKKVGRGTGAVALESIGEGVGEYLGELAATGKASPTDAALEALAGLGMSVGELAGVSAKLTSPGTLTKSVGGAPSESDLVGDSNTRDVTGLDDYNAERKRYELTKALAKKPEETISTLAAIFKTESDLTDEGKVARQNILAAVDRLGVKDQFNIYLNDTKRVQDGIDILSNAPALRGDTLYTVETIAKNLPAANAGPTGSQSEIMQEFADQTDPIRLADNTTPLVVGNDPILLQFMSNTTGSGGQQTFGSQYQVLPINQQTFDDYLQTANGNNYSAIQEFLDDNMLDNGTVTPTHIVMSRGLADQSNGTGNFEFRGVGTKNSIENFFNDQSRRKYFTPVRTFNNDVSNLFGKIDDASPEGAKSYVNKSFKLSQEALAKEQDEQLSAPPAAQQTRLPEEHSALLSEINYLQGVANLPAVASQDVNIKPLPDYLKQIGDLFSVRLIGFSGKADYYGLSSGSSNKIYINVDKLNKVSGLWILGHEVWHQLETRNPAMASKVAQDLVAYMRDEKFNDYSGKLLSLGYSKSDINSEIAGDLMGLVFNDRQFWESVEVKNPSLVSKVKDILTKIIDRIQSVLKKAEGRYGRASKLGGYLKDYKAARDLLAGIAAKLATAPRQSASAPGPSAAMADDESSPRELTKGAIKQAQDSSNRYIEDAYEGLARYDTAETFQDMDAELDARQEAVKAMRAIGINISDDEARKFFSKDEDGKIKAVFFPELRTVFYSAAVKRLPPQAVAALRLHEIGAHYGIERMIGAEQYQKLLNDLRERRGKDKLIDRAYAAVPQDTNSRLIDHEALGYLVEHYQNSPLAVKVLQAIKDWFVKTFGKKMTATELHDLALGAFNAYSSEIREVISKEEIKEKPPESFAKVNFQEALDETPVAKKFLTILSAPDLLPLWHLSGSLAIAAQADVYRTPDEKIHDLDITVGDHAGLDKIFEALLAEFPRFTILRTFYSSKTSSEVISIAVGGPDTGGQITIDIFINNGEEASGMSLVPVEFDTGTDAGKVTMMVSNKDFVFGKKMAMGRPKDVTDALVAKQYNASFSKSEKGDDLEAVLSEMSDDEREAYLEAKLPNKQLVAAIDAVMLDLAKKGEGRSLNDLSEKLMKRMYSSKEFFFHSRRVTRSMLANSWQKLPLALRTPSTSRQISEWISAPQRAEEEEAKVADRFEPAGTYKRTYSKYQKPGLKTEQPEGEVAPSTPAKKRKSRIDLLRDRFEAGLRNLTNIRYLDETKNLIQKRIAEISEEILELNRVRVEKDGLTTVYKLQEKEDESPMLWASRKETEYDFDTKVAGYSGEALSKKDALLLEYAQLRDELGAVRDSSLFSALASSDRKLAKTEREANELRRQESPESERQARLYRLAISRLTDELFKMAEKEIEDGANPAAVRALWAEYYPQLTFLTRYEESVLADRVKEMERERADANELLSGEREPAREPTQEEFLASVAGDLSSGKVSIPEAMSLIDKAASRGELKDKQVAIRNTLIDLVGDLAFVNDDKVYSKRLNQIIAWAGAASREGALTFADFNDIFHMQGVDIPASASANTFVAVSTRMTDHLAKVGNDYAQRDGWYRSMDRALSFNPDLLNIGLFTDAEKAGYEAWKEDRAAVKGRRTDKGGSTLEEAFPDALFMEHTLAEMKDPTKLEKRDQARLSSIPDLADAYFADIYHVVDARPDLASQVFDQISASEKQEYMAWIDRKWKGVELEIEMASRAANIDTLLQLPAMPDEMLANYRTQLIRASALIRPQILQNAIDSSRAIVNPDAAPQGGTVDPDTGEILPFGAATETQMLSETVESLRNLGMMEPGSRSNLGARYVADIGVGGSLELGLADPNLRRISIETFESDRGQAGAGDLSTDDLINSGDLELSQNDEDAPVETDDESRLAQGTFVGVMANRLVNDHVAEITASWPNAPQIVVLANHLDLPQELRDEVAQKLQDGMGAKGLFDPRTGITYLFSDYLSSKEDTQWTIFHEIYGHLGMRAFQGANFDAFLESMYRSNSDVRAQADSRIAQGGIGKLEAIDEVLADMAADKPEAGVVKQWVGQVIAGLRKAGFDRLANFMGNMTNAELAYSLAMAKKYAQRGGYSPLQSGPRDVRLAQAKAPWEIFAMVSGNVKAFARYNPLLDEWYLFEATGLDIRDGAQPAITLQGQDAVTQHMTRYGGRIEKRTRSGFFRPGKIASDLVTFKRREDEGLLLQKLRNFKYKWGQSFLPIYTVMDQAEKMGRMSDSFDLRKYLRLYERKTADRVARFNQTFVYPIFDLLGQAKKAKGTYGFGATNVYEMLNKFLLAQHAEERNKRVEVANPGTLKGSGMETQEADDILRFVASQPYAQAFLEIGKLLDRMSNEKVDGEERAGLLTRVQAAMRRQSYRHYRNLSGVNPKLDPDFSDDPSLGTGRLFNARGKEKRAMGRSDEAPDILARTILGAEASIIRQEKNGIAQRVLAFFETNYDPSFLTINKQAQTRVISPTTGFVEIVDDTSHYNDPTVMVARVSGIPVTMQFKEQGFGSFGEAIHGRVMKEPNALMHVVNQLTRFVGSALTVYSPAWALLNAYKDIQTLFLNSAVDSDVKTGIATKMMARLPLAIYTSLYGHIMELQPTSAIGKKAKAGVLKIIPHSIQMLRDLDEAKRAGAITSFINREGLEDQVVKIHEAINGKSVASRVTGLLKFIELLTVPIEQGPRLAAYTTLRREGWTQTDAAVFSGKVTVDFNARGQNEAVRQLYIFFNPAVQGTLGMIDLAKKDPKRFAVAVGALTAAGFLIGMMTRAAADDEEDKNKNGKNVLDELPTSKRATLIIVKPETPFGAFPLPYGWNFFYAAGVFASDSVVGKTPWATSVARTAQAALQAFSPIGGGSGFDITKAPSDPVGQGFRLLTPFVGVPMMQWYLNTNRQGGPLYPDSEFSGTSGKSATTQTFRTVNPISKGFTEWLQEVTGGNRRNQDGIDINPALIDHLISSYVPGLASDIYRATGKSIRIERGEKIPRMESSDVSSIMMAQVADRFAAYPSEGKDAASFRLVKEELGNAYEELLRTPQGDPRRKQITDKHPGLATAVSMIAVVEKNLRAENMTLRRIEDESYIALRSGDIEKSKKLQAQAVQFENKLKETQKTLYAKANKVFIQAGFQDLVLSTD